MPSLREARAAAVRRRYRDLCDSLTETMPLLLDDLDAVDRAHVPDMVAVKNGLDPSDAELAAWVERNPKAFADWAATQARIAPPARAARRPRGGAAT